MPSVDATATLQKVSALRALCLKLPHVPTPAEQALLGRFETLVAMPEIATLADIEALAAGWRQWWREGRLSPLCDMAERLPRAVVERDRRLAAYLTGARLCLVERREAPIA